MIQKTGMNQAQLDKHRSARFDIDCRRCERLAAFLDEVKQSHPGYYCRPVPSFGDPEARILLVGLAPGKHGANATGRPFTGDYAGVLLYQTLHDFGLASQPEALSADDGLTLRDIRIANAVKCLPPENKPTTLEADNCREYLVHELADPRLQLVIALGGIAHRAVLKAQGQVLSQYAFAHGSEHQLPSGLTLISSYHCSRYNTQTGRLTAEMFSAVFARALALL